MKRLSWKYIAGLVDGEGCIDVQVSKHRANSENPYIRPRLRIAMAENAYPVLEILHANHGGQLHKRNRKSSNPNWMDAYAWGLHGKQCRPFLQNIVKHLILKHEQAKLCIWMIDEVMGKWVSQDAKERLRDELKAMKRDPHRLSEKAISEIQTGIRPMPWPKHAGRCMGCGSQARKYYTNGYCDACWSVTRRKNHAA